MKVIYSPLVSQARGSAGPLTASAWKGINYIRERITPSNPDTDKQRVARAAITRCVSWWHDLEAQVVTYINSLVAGQAISGFNTFTKRNAKDMHEEDPCRIIPLNTAVNPIANLVAITGSNAGDIDLTWDQGEAPNGLCVYVLAAPKAAGTYNPIGYPDNLVVENKDTITVQTEGFTLPNLTPDTDYFVYVMVESATLHKFSVALQATAKSHA